MKKLGKMLRKLPLRLRGLIAILVLLVMAWGPLVIALIECLACFRVEVRETYADWFSAVRKAGKALLGGRSA